MHGSVTLPLAQRQIRRNIADTQWQKHVKGATSNQQPSLSDEKILNFNTILSDLYAMPTKFMSHK